MSKVILSIGIPGAGKTTYLKQFATEHGYDYLSSDEIRQEIIGDYYDQTKNVEVFEALRQRAADSLAHGHTVVIDATFAQQEGREMTLKFLREAGAEKIQGIFFDTPIEIAKERNAERELQTKETSIERMDKTLKKYPPELTEGFDTLIVLDEHREPTYIEMNREGNEIKWERRIH